jgi:hypothetical protein
LPSGRLACPAKKVSVLWEKLIENAGIEKQ